MVVLRLLRRGRAAWGSLPRRRSSGRVDLSDAFPAVHESSPYGPEHAIRFGCHLAARTSTEPRHRHHIASFDLILECLTATTHSHPRRPLSKGLRKLISRVSELSVRVVDTSDLQRRIHRAGDRPHETITLTLVGDDLLVYREREPATGEVAGDVDRALRGQLGDSWRGEISDCWDENRLDVAVSRCARNVAVSCHRSALHKVRGLVVPARKGRGLLPGRAARENSAVLGWPWIPRRRIKLRLHVSHSTAGEQNRVLTHIKLVAGGIALHANEKGATHTGLRSDENGEWWARRTVCAGEKETRHGTPPEPPSDRKSVV